MENRNDDRKKLLIINIIIWAAFLILFLIRLKIDPLEQLISNMFALSDLSDDDISNLRLAELIFTEYASEFEVTLLSIGLCASEQYVAAIIFYITGTFAKFFWEHGSSSLYETIDGEGFINKLLIFTADFGKDCIGIYIVLLASYIVSVFLQSVFLFLYNIDVMLIIPLLAVFCGVFLVTAIGFYLKKNFKESVRIIFTYDIPVAIMLVIMDKLTNISEAMDMGAKDILSNSSWTVCLAIIFIYDRCWSTLVKPKLYDDG